MLLEQIQFEKYIGVWRHLQRKHSTSLKIGPEQPQGKPRMSYWRNWTEERYFGKPDRRNDIMVPVQNIVPSVRNHTVPISKTEEVKHALELAHTHPLLLLVRHFFSARLWKVSKYTCVCCYRKPFSGSTYGTEIAYALLINTISQKKVKSNIGSLTYRKQPSMM